MRVACSDSCYDIKHKPATIKEILFPPEMAMRLSCISINNVRNDLYDEEECVIGYNNDEMVMRLSRAIGLVKW